MQGTIRITIVAGFEPLRVGLSRMIAAVPDMHVSAEVNDFAELFASGALTESDVFLVDVEALNGADRGSRANVTEWLPALKVLFLGSREDARVISPDDLPAYMKLDTVGFVLKDGESARLIEAIRLIARGLFVCENDVIKRIITRLTHWASYTDGADSDQQLTERETGVLALVAKGFSNREIAQDLFLSEGTVKAHISHIMAKLNADRRTDLVRFAFATGIVPLTEDADANSGRR